MTPPVYPRFPLSWLTIGIASLAASGVFSIIVSFAWHPSVRCVALFETLFHRSLITHVNLSISVWFMAILFMVWSYRPSSLPFYDATARWLTIATIVFMSIAALLPEAVPLLSNYVPTLEHPLFFVSLGCMTAAIIVKSMEIFYGYIHRPDMTNESIIPPHACGGRPGGGLSHHVRIENQESRTTNLNIPDSRFPIPDSATALPLSPSRKQEGEPLQQPYITLKTYTLTSLFMLLVALGAFVASYQGIDRAITGEIYYEMLFWGGGHVLQFVWVQLTLIAWILLLEALVPGYRAHRGYRALLIINALAVLTTPIPYFLYEVTSADFRQMFSLLMAWICGVAPVLFVLLYIVQAAQGKHPLLPRYRHPLGACLWWSLILFGLGGMFGVMIDGINVKIPAHYHGSLLGVTLALMGLTYLTLMAHDYEYMERSKLAIWQPTLLGVGQIMHIVGLFWSGGYGVERKNPCAGGEAMQQADLALRIQSTGGGIAILGGLLFVIVCMKAWKGGKTLLDKPAATE